MSDTRFALAFRRPPPVVKATLILLVAAFLAAAVGAQVSSGFAAVVKELVLVPGEVLARPWTLVTYALVQNLNDPWNFLFNCVAIYFFAPELEARWGSKKFVAFMLSAVLGGALLDVLLSVVGLGGAVALGPIAVCFATIVAWGLFFRDRPTYFFFFQVKGIHLVLITVAFEVYNAVTHGFASTATAFGGGLVGLAWAGLATGPLRQAILKRRLAKLEVERDVLAGRRKAAAAGFRVIPGGKSEDDDKKRWLN